MSLWATNRVRSTVRRFLVQTRVRTIFAVNSFVARNGCFTRLPTKHTYTSIQQYIKPYIRTYTHCVVE